MASVTSLLLRSTTVAVVLASALANGLCAQDGLSADDEAPPVRWSATPSLSADSLLTDQVRSYPLDSLAVVAHHLLRRLQDRGYYDAQVTRVDTTGSADRTGVRFHVARGPRAIVERIRVSGVRHADSTVVANLVETAPGEVASDDRLEADIDRILRHYSSIGYPLASVRVDRVSLTEESGRLRIDLMVDEGPAVVLDRLELLGAERTSSRYVARLLNLSPGERLLGFDPDQIRRELLATGVFAAVGEPRLVSEAGRGAVLQLPVQEAGPGQFDLVLGYKPPSGGASGQLIGNGFLDLHNLFGGGRRFEFEMDRLSGQVSETRAAITLPFAFGSPLRIGVQFEGYQRDSTYGKRELSAQVGYRVPGGLELLATGRWGVVRPGIYGFELSIARSTVWAGGLGVRYRDTDHRINPQRGLRFDVLLTHGRKIRPDTAAVIEQQRLESGLRGFVPTFERQVLALGYDAWLLNSPVYDQADLYRVGGTRTLRGHAEDQYLVRLGARLLAEYRVQFDAESYGFVFVDGAYLVRPRYRTISSREGWRLGYGAGAQVQTSVGLVELSYALAPGAGVTNGRVHIGMRLGL